MEMNLQKDHDDWPDDQQDMIVDQEGSSLQSDIIVRDHHNDEDS